MPVLTSYRHGLTAGTPPMSNAHQRVKRGTVGGWSAGATRRNTRFLYSVREQELTGDGYAVTLTLRDCPATAQDFHALRRKWQKRMERAGMVRLHWVIEWQRRGVPHLHGAIWFDGKTAAAGDAYVRNLMQSAWLMAGASGDYRAGYGGQFVRVIDGAVGWFQYMSKHAARGVKHYQRSPEGIPEGWQGRTGRMWGHIGQWPVRDGIRIELDGENGDGGYFAFRRLVRAWRVADARASGDRWRLRSARRMLLCHQRPLSTVRGVSEWIPEHVQDALLANLAARGYHVVG